MGTDELIVRLARDARPVRRLPPPHIRALAWLSAALPLVALVVLAMGPRPDLAVKLSEARFLIEQSAALATALSAAGAAFALIVPDTGWRATLLPAVPLGAWLFSLGIGCVADWLRLDVADWRIALDPACLPYIALVGAAPAIVMVMMLRRGAPLSPRMTMTLGGLAAAALGSFGLRFFHPQDAGLMVLLWQFGSVVLLSAMAGAVGHRILRWRHSRLST